ncbi:MAG: glycine dehydrogenase (aminomethyl-transferring), partial [Actinobacteria bacterium]|nr:glycine dehydrogenase (aminomethyl-transferring) [Actinomycetota bacterium]
MSDRSSLSRLLATDDFVDRHIGPTPDEQAHMLSVIGVGSLDELITTTVPGSILIDGPLPLPGPRTVDDVLGELRAIAGRNRARTSLIGQGYYGTVCPPVIVRNVLENPGWYTAYTPYQPEISQGRLEALLNFQTMIAELTGFELANASLLDEATAAAEAMTMARRTSKSTSDRFLVHHDTHPQTINVLRTRAEPIGLQVVVGDLDEIDGGCFGVLLSLPTSTGAVPDWRAAIQRVHDAGAIAVVATDLLACVLTTPPGRLGADIAIGSAQRFGVPMGFGGPHAAFIAASEATARSLPGRLVGVSTDTEGRPSLRLALQTREQHIRREKATSNICTAQVLLANMAGFYATWHGPEGLRRIAERVHRLTGMAATALRASGIAPLHDSWFDTLTVPCAADDIIAAGHAAGLDLRRVDDAHVAFSFDETTSVDIVRGVLSLFGAAMHLPDDIEASSDGIATRRSDDFLSQSVFHRYHTEHEMLRYLRRLCDKDLALDRTMIPLGSCTMKLNAAAEMMP